MRLIVQVSHARVTVSRNWLIFTPLKATGQLVISACDRSVSMGQDIDLQLTPCLVLVYRRVVALFPQVHARPLWALVSCGHPSQNIPY